MTRTPGRYGRLPATRPIGLRPLAHYFPGRRLPAAPADFDLTAGVNAWGMLGNGPDPTLTVNSGQPLGDCAFAGAAHLRMIGAAQCAEPQPTFTADQVATSYLHYTHGRDVGANLADLLATWQRVGLFGSRIVGYAPVNCYDPQEMLAATYWFDGLYVGIAVPEPAQQQFAAGEPWDLTGTVADRQIEGGHCVVFGAPGKAVTWGAVQSFTEAWAATYVEEAFAVITPELAARHGDGHGLAVDQLLADLNRLN